MLPVIGNESNGRSPGTKATEVAETMDWELQFRWCRQNTEENVPREDLEVEKNPKFIF